MPLTEQLIERIRRHGPVPVTEVMALALSHPEYGYYMRRDPLGAQGDFTTAPEMTQVFGEILGAWLAEQWQRLGSPTSFALAELGPGRGTLMADILRTTKKVPRFHDGASVYLIEISPVLRQLQWQTLASAHGRVNWQATVDELPELPLLLVANEFFDALPIQQFVDGKERCVGLDAQGELCFVPTGEAVREVCIPACAVMQSLARHVALHGGVLLVIDYGHAGDAQGDTLQAVKNHRYHPVLKDLGEADLTAHVDFGALKEVAQAEGLAVHGPVPQGRFLLDLGAAHRTAQLTVKASPEQRASLIAAIERLTAPEHMGRLFKVMAVTQSGVPFPDGFSG